jgi:hypothetical protein
LNPKTKTNKVSNMSLSKTNILKTNSKQSVKNKNQLEDNNVSYKPIRLNLKSYFKSIENKEQSDEKENCNKQSDENENCNKQSDENENCNKQSHENQDNDPKNA